MNFKTLLHLNQDTFLPDQERVRHRVLTRRSKTVKLAVASSTVCVALALAITGILLFERHHPAELIVQTGEMNIIESVAATDQTNAGLDVQSKLKIKTKTAVTLAELKSRIALSPEAAYTVKKTDDQDFEISFKEDLSESTLYNLEAVYNGTVVYRWAFQTSGSFSVTGASLKNAKQVPLDTAVEVTFSYADVSGFEDQFRITPALKGTFTHYGRTWAFVPSEKLAPSTMYTVTVGKGVHGPDQQALDADYSFSFTTANEGAYAYLMYQSGEVADTFLVKETPVAAIAFDQLSLGQAEVEVYRLESSDAFIKAYQSYVRNGCVSPDIMALAGTPVTTFTATPSIAKSSNEWSGSIGYIGYPDPLTQGYYFSKIQTAGGTFYQLVESTTLSVYTVTTNGDYAIWVNDTTTGLPVSGAKVRLDGAGEATASKQGIARFQNVEKNVEQRFLVVQQEAYPYVAVLDGSGTNAAISTGNAYYTYLSTNSSIYKPTDQVGVFGMILPRKSGAKLPKTVTLAGNFMAEPLTVELSENGSFSLQVPLSAGALSSGTLQLLVDQQQLDETTFEIADYELPTYLLNVYMDQMLYQTGQTATVTLQVTYMDGSPAPGMHVFGDYDLQGVTDENGCVTGSFSVEESKYNDNTDANYPEVRSYSFRLTDGTAQYYSRYSSFLVFSSNYLLSASYENKMITIHSNQVDFAKAKAMDSDQIFAQSQQPSLYQGDAVSLEFTGELHEISYQKKQTGTTYDAINKKVIYSYGYKEQDALVRTFRCSTVNGVGTVSLSETPDVGHNYYVLLRVAGENDTGTLRIYLTKINYVNQYGTGAYSLVADQNTVGLGEPVNLGVRDRADNEMVSSGSLFFTALSGEILGAFYSDSTHYSVSFQQEFAPDVLLYGAYFDGKHVHDLGSEWIQYRKEDAKLNISMEADQAQYQPGDTVSLKFKVTDQMGNPVKTALNISVLDRALYLLSGEPEQPLEHLYRVKAYETPVYTTASYRDFTKLDLSGGEGGGGGAGEARSNFEDTPYFDTVQTGQNGEAEVQFELPDSITEWKVVAKSVSGQVQGGMETFDLRSTQSYFLTVSMGTSIKTTDDCTVAVKSDGFGITANAMSSFTVGLTDRDGNEIKTLTGEAQKSQYVYLNFGLLDEGLYTLYIQGSSGNRKDGVIENLSVVKSVSTLWVHQEESLNGDRTLSLSPASGNVTLTIADEKLRFWQAAMNRLQYSSGNRVDQVLGQYLADRFFADGVWMSEEKTDYSVLRSYLTSGGVTLLPYEEKPDLKISAMLAAAAPRFTDQDQLARALEEYLNNRYAARADVLCAYWGLAALGKPVLTDLQKLYQANTDFSLEENLYLALGFAYCGDYETARYLFDQQIKSALVQEGGAQYLQTESAPDEALTGCLVLLASRLSLDCSEGLLQFILVHNSEKTLLNLELIAYLSDYVENTVGQNTVTMATGDGRNQQYSYQKMKPLVLTLTPEQAKNVRILSGEGNSWISYDYLGTLEQLEQVRTGTVFPGVTLPATVARGKTGTLQVRVTLPDSYDAAQLTLVLPAGLRFESGTLQTTSGPSSINAPWDDRTVRLALEKGSNTLQLQVRGSLPGSYELEPVLVVNATDGQYLLSDPQRIAVGGTT